MNRKTKFKNEQPWTLFRKLAASRIGLLLLCVATVTSPAQTYSILHEFNGTDGSGPMGVLLLSGAELYGTTQNGGSSVGTPSGGSHGVGTIFQFNTDSSSFNTLWQFTGNDAAYPQSLALFGDTLFGTALSPNCGTIFSVATNGTGFTNLFVFNGDGSSGENPIARLVLSGNTLYGTTQYGGTSNCGTIFMVNTDGTGFTILRDFAGSDGAYPSTPLTLSGTTLYGTTCNGGVSNNGTIFKINCDGSGFVVLKGFTGEDGANPSGTLLLSGTTLYGTTMWGGSFDSGTVFEINTDGTGFNVLSEFMYLTNNFDTGLPSGDLALSGSTLYGTTQSGGAYGAGTVFQVNTDGTSYAVLKSFRGDYSDGGYPSGGLVLSGTTLYGATPAGSCGNFGTLFGLSLLPAGPTILLPPQDQTEPVGSTVDFAVDAVGSPPLGYQWFINGTNAISDATNSILELANVQYSQSETYSVVVSNTYGTVTSLVANLTVEDPFIESIQPGSQTVNLGQTAQFSAVIDGTAPLGYQWNKDGTVLAGATSSSLTVSDAMAENAGYYGVVVSNVFGIATSSVAPLTVNLAVVDSLNVGFSEGEYITAVAVQPDGDILAGGAGATLVRFHADGTPDLTFSPNVGSSVIPVYAIAVQNDGTFFVTGNFVQGNLLCNCIIRFNADGTIDTTFNAVAYRYIYCLLVQSDGKIVVGGDFTTLDGQSCTNIGRLNADGSLDTTFNSAADGSVYCLALQKDGKILAGGDFATLCGATRAGIGRLNTDGSLDTAFNPGANNGAQLRAIAVQQDGKILVGGGSTCCAESRVEGSGGSMPTALWTPASIVQAAVVGCLASPSKLTGRFLLPAAVDTANRTAMALPASTRMAQWISTSIREPTGRFIAWRCNPTGRSSSVAFFKIWINPRAPTWAGWLSTSLQQYQIIFRAKRSRLGTRSRFR